MLHANRIEHIKTENRNYVNHWVRRLVHTIVQQSKISNDRKFTFTDIQDLDETHPLSYDSFIAECFLEDIVTELKKRFPDSEVTYVDGALTVDWS
jgi:hypothetical protein